jgi:hypothetical protein
MNWPPRSWIRLDDILSNGAGTIGWLEAGGSKWPVTLQSERPPPAPSWMTSVTSALIATPRDEISQRTPLNRTMQWSLRALDAVLPFAAILGLDRAVIVNNTLLSVSLVGPGDGPSLMAAVEAAARQWPDRMIFARGLIGHGPDTTAAARALGGVVLPNRVGYTFDLRDGRYPEKVNAARDRALLHRRALIQIDHDAFSTRDLDSAQMQYRSLYVVRHGAANPDFKAAFFGAAHRTGAVEFVGLRDDRGLVAFAGLREHGAFLSVPLLGYRDGDDLRAGNYRAMFARVLEIAANRRRAINFGAGAGHFKRLRGGVETLESMVIVAPRRSLAGTALRFALTAAESRLRRWVPAQIAALGG